MSRTKTAPANTAVAYLRVSTDEQADSGAGLDAQRAAITAEATRRGWTITEWHVDAGVSGKSLSGRPALLDALDAVRGRRAAALVVAKLDRLSRSLLDFAGLMADAQRERWNLVALDLGIDLSTPAGEFMANVMASAAQWERRIIGQRTRDALAMKKAAGVRLGRPAGLPAEIMSRILAARAAGQSFQKVADALNADAVPTAQGGAKWHASTVRAVAVSQDAAKLAGQDAAELART
jgi:DNA invertase Pin-like site-specific DNA recombinase